MPKTITAFDRFLPNKHVWRPLWHESRFGSEAQRWERFYSFQKVGEELRRSEMAALSIALEKHLMVARQSGIRLDGEARGIARILRHRNELNWSDWLAELLAWPDAEADFVRNFFFGLQRSTTPADLRREHREKNRRADIVAVWKTGGTMLGGDIEVKIGDGNLKKTISTTALLERSRKFGVQISAWEHILLIEESQLTAWKRHKGGEGISVRTWEHFASCLAGKNFQNPKLSAQYSLLVNYMLHAILNVIGINVNETAAQKEIPNPLKAGAILRGTYDR